MSCTDNWDSGVRAYTGRVSVRGGGVYMIGCRVWVPGTVINNGLQIYFAQYENKS